MTATNSNINNNQLNTVSTIDAIIQSSDLKKTGVKTTNSNINNNQSNTVSTTDTIIQSSEKPDIMPTNKILKYK